MTQEGILRLLILCCNVLTRKLSKSYFSNLTLLKITNKDTFHRKWFKGGMERWPPPPRIIDHGLHKQVSVVVHEEGGVGDGGGCGDGCGDGGQMLSLILSWLNRHAWKHTFCPFLSLTLASMYKSIMEFMRKVGRAIIAGYDDGGDGGLTVQMLILFPSWLNRHFLPFFFNKLKVAHWHFFYLLDHGLHVRVHPGVREEGGVDGGVVQMLILFPSWLLRHTWKHIFYLFFLSHWPWPPCTSPSLSSWGRWWPRCLKTVIQKSNPISATHTKIKILAWKSN